MYVNIVFHLRMWLNLYYPETFGGILSIGCGKGYSLKISPLHQQC